MKKNIVFLALIITMLPSLAFSKTIYVLIHPFQNLGEKQYEWISSGLTDEIINDLSYMKEIGVISNSDRKSITEEAKYLLGGYGAEKSSWHIGKYSGANIMLTGQYLVSGKDVVAHLCLINVDKGEKEISFKISGKLEDLFELQDKISLAILSNIAKVNINGVEKVQISESEKKRIAHKTRSKNITYELYAKGLNLSEIKPQDALNYFKKALEIDENYVPALVNAGLVAGFKLQSFEEAFRYLDRADKVLKTRNENNTTEYAKLTINFGFMYIIGKSDREKALQCLLSAQTIMDNIGLQDTYDYAMLMEKIGIIYQFKRADDIAQKYCIKSKHVLDKLGLKNTWHYVLLVIKIGFYDYASNYDAALQCLLSAQEIAKNLGLTNTSFYANNVTSIGQLYSMKGVFKYFEDEDSKKNMVSNRNIENSNKNNVSKRCNQDIDSAMNYFMHAKVIMEKVGLHDSYKYAELLVKICDTYMFIDNDNAKRAFEYIAENQKMYEKRNLNYTAGYALMLKKMGMLYQKQGNKEMAGKFYRKSYEIYNGSGFMGYDKKAALENAVSLGY